MVAIDGDTLDNFNTNHGTIVGNPRFTNGLAGQAMFFDGVDDGVRMNVSPELNWATLDAFTFETWFNVPNGSRRNVLFEFEDGSSFAGPHMIASEQAPGEFGGNLTGVGNSVHAYRTPSGLFAANTWNHVALTINRTNGALKVYVNGTNVFEKNVGVFVWRPNNTVFLGRRNSPGFEETMEGLLDAPAFYSRELTATEVRTLVEANAGSKCAVSTGTGTNFNCAPPANLIAWWPFDGDGGDIVGTNNGTLVGSPVFETGKVGQAMIFDVVNDEMDVPASASLNVGASDGFTIETWLKPRDLQAQQPIVEWSDGTNPGVHFWYSQAGGISGGPGSLFANVIDNSNVSHFLGSVGGLLVTGVWQHVGLTYDKLSGIGSLFLNGNVVTQRNLGTFIPRTQPPLQVFVGRRPGQGFRMAGSLDELSIYNRVLSAIEMQSVFASGGLGKCRFGSFLTTSPTSGALAPGDTTNVTVALKNLNTLAAGRYPTRLLFTNTTTGRGSTQRMVQIDVFDPSTVVSRLIFYNHSSWDGTNSAANTNDDFAIAADKVALRRGQVATFTNYTSFNKGINGVMIDLALSGIPTVGDFTFKVGNDNMPDSWATAPAPTNITVRAAAGVAGTDRVTLIWSNNAIQKQWLEVTVLPTANTGLPTPDVFYFGHAIGESGNSTNDAKVDPADELGARAHPRNALDPAPIDDHYDYNRDKRVDPGDELIARANQTSALNALKLIDLSALGGTSFGASGAELAKTTGEKALASVMSAPAQENTEPRKTSGPTLGRLSVRHDSPGTIVLEMRGETGRDYQLEVTDNPVSERWRTLENAPLQLANGILQWTVSIPDPSPQRFYRVVSSSE
jgi:hypothetical protein